MIVRAGYLVDEQLREDRAEGPDYETAKAALPERQAQRIWITIER
jgi:hypothetical protein